MSSNEEFRYVQVFSYAIYLICPLKYPYSICSYNFCFLIAIIILLLWEIFTPASAEGFSLKFDWQLIS